MAAPWRVLRRSDARATMQLRFAVAINSMMQVFIGINRTNVGECEL
jgi:hypothetical protein